MKRFVVCVKKLFIFFKNSVKLYGDIWMVLFLKYSFGVIKSFIKFCIYLFNSCNKCLIMWKFVV